LPQMQNMVKPFTGVSLQHTCTAYVSMHRLSGLETEGFIRHAVYHRMCKGVYSVVMQPCMLHALHVPTYFGAS
jgi:hypothetical protein